MDTPSQGFPRCLIPLFTLPLQLTATPEPTVLQAGVGTYGGQGRGWASPGQHSLSSSMRTERTWASQSASRGLFRSLGRKPCPHVTQRCRTGLAALRKSQRLQMTPAGARVPSQQARAVSCLYDNGPCEVRAPGGHSAFQNTRDSQMLRCVEQ